jgi:hypothetical protein
MMLVRPKGEVGQAKVFVESKNTHKSITKQVHCKVASLTALMIHYQYARFFSSIYTVSHNLSVPVFHQLFV